MNRVLKIVMIIIFVCILLGTPTVYYTIKGINGKDSDIVKSIDFDLEEKRELEELEYDNVYDFPSKFEIFFNDHIPFRSFLIQTKRDVEGFVESPYINYIQDFLLSIGKKKKKKQTTYSSGNEKYMEYAVKQFTNHTLMPSEIELVDDIEYPLKTMGSVILGRKKWLFYNSNNITYYKGANILEDNKYEGYVNELEKIDNLCKEKGKKIIFLMIPDKDQVYSEYMPTIERENEKGKIQRIKEYIATNSDITFMYPKDLYMDMKKNYRVYKKYDTHFNNAGAYILYNEIMKRLGKDVVDIDDIKIDKVYNQTGDLVPLSGQSFSNYMDDIDYFIHYKDDVDIELLKQDTDGNKDGNGWVSLYQSTDKNGEHIIFLGDSFKEVLVNYICKNYETSLFVGYNNSKKSQYIEKGLESANTIILEMVERNEEQLLPMWIGTLSQILNKLPSIDKVE